ncbi:hypothetical protein HZH68_003428 [Vespula germanica]|uniref:Uncharacterized protein n=1 Tax=Vespula germanica TaxID=30212 RepID=A0A834NP80_VESGE|nr:hypothetical protein HZH68_003428 [Vespula germanica]
MIDLNRKLGALVTYGELVEERIPTSVNRFRFNGEDGKIVERLREPLVTNERDSWAEGTISSATVWYGLPMVCQGTKGRLD